MLNNISATNKKKNVLYKKTINTKPYLPKSNKTKITFFLILINKYLIFNFMDVYLTCDKLHKLILLG